MTRSRRTALTALVLLLGSGLGLGLGSPGSAGARTSETLDDRRARLALVAERVTLRARPTTVFSTERVTLFGSVDSGRTGEDVKIQAKDCGLDFFRVVSGAITKEGGAWSTFYWLPGPSTTLRAVWDEATSAEVTIRKRASVILRKRSAGRFEVWGYGRLVWRKRVFIQRFDRRLGTWQAVKAVVLTESESARGARAIFNLSLPKGTLVRALFPRSQAGACYLTGTSNRLRT